MVYGNGEAETANLKLKDESPPQFNIHEFVNVKS